MFNIRNIFKKPGLILVALGLLAGATLGYAGLALAGSGSPGSPSDPLVTKSFVEKYVRDYVNKNSPAPVTPVSPVSPGPGVITGADALAWTITELDPGQEFIGQAGTEFIVRSGGAVVVDPTGSGIPDLTSGTNVKAGQTAGNNHLFIVPKADGRGIKATKTTVVMYRGF